MSRAPISARGPMQVPAPHAVPKAWSHCSEVTCPLDKQQGISALLSGTEAQD